MLLPPPPINDDFQLQEFLRQVRDFLTVTTTATLDFPNTVANATADLTVTLRGVKTGDAVIVSPPSTMVTGVSWCGFVSANDTVTVRIHISGAAAIDLASGLWRITVFKY